MFRHADWTHPGAAATMWNCEGLVQVKVANVRSDVAGPTPAETNTEPKSDAEK